MQNIALSLRSIKLLSVSYISSIIIIICLLILRQGLFQYFYQQQKGVMSEIITLNNQETRAGDIFFDVIELQNPDPHANYQPFILSIETNNVQWVKDQYAFYISAELSGASKATLIQEKPEFDQMEKAAAHILLLEKNKTKEESNDILSASVRPDAALFFYKEQHYISTLIHARDELVQNFVSTSNTIQTLEIIIFCFIIFVILAETLYIMLPVIKHLRTFMAELMHTFDILDKIEEKEKHE